MSNPVYDLEERLLGFAANVVELTERLPATRAGNHIALQLLRSGTSPLPNHGEAQAAESRGDFVHKMSVCLKELREASRWLRLILKVKSMSAAAADAKSVLQEAEELTRIFRKSIETAKTNAAGTRERKHEPPPRRTKGYDSAPNS